jgi:hypothetical protein
MTTEELHDQEPDPPEIVGECPRCGLVIYDTDETRMIVSHPDADPLLYHEGCGRAQQGELWEAELTGVISRLRAYGYLVEYKITRPQSH